MRKQRLYMSVVCLGGVALLGLSFSRALALFANAQTRTDTIVLSAVMLLFLTICHMLPVYITADKTMEISFVPMVAVLVTRGVDLAVTLFAISCLLVFLQDTQTHRYYSPWLRKPVNELFNVCNAAISIWLGGQLFGWIVPGGASEVFTLRVVLAAVVFSCGSILINLVFFLLYFHFSNLGRFFTLLRENISGIIPNIIATIPLGLVIGYMLTQPKGYLWIALFMGPLLLARYSFKIYLDSRSSLIRTIGSLAQAVEAKDPYTMGHSQRVAYFSCELCGALGCSRRFTEQIKIAALLHDTGKIGIDDAILRKPGPLTDEEYEAIREHPVIGKRIIESIRLPSAVNDAVLYHHRWYNGEGYPPAKRGEGPPPLSASILSVADCYDAMISDRPYRRGMTSREACAELRAVSGTQLDPKVVAAFLMIEPTLRPNDAETLRQYTI